MGLLSRVYTNIIILSVVVIVILILIYVATSFIA